MLLEDLLDGVFGVHPRCSTSAPSHFCGYVTFCCVDIHTPHCVVTVNGYLGGLHLLVTLNTAAVNVSVFLCGQTFPFPFSRFYT